MSPKEFAERYYKDIEFSQQAFELATKQMAEEIDKYFISRDENSGLSITIVLITVGIMIALKGLFSF